MLVGGRLNLHTCTGQCIAASRAILSQQTRTFNHAMVKVWDERLLRWTLGRPRTVLAGVSVLVLTQLHDPSLDGR